MTKRIGQALITPQELKNAIFIDYEGSMNLPPTLLGTLIGDTYQAAIVEPIFATCAKRYRAKNTEAYDHLPFCATLLKRAETEDRCLIAWSEHDYKKMMEDLAQYPELISLLNKRYRNAIYTAKKLYRLLHSKSPKDRSLPFFAILSSYAIPDKYGTNLVGNGLRLIRGQLKKGRAYPDLTDAAKKAWITIVKHNEHDLRSMQHVLTWLNTATSSP